MSFLFVALLSIYICLAYFYPGDKVIHARFAEFMWDGSMSFAGNFIFYVLIIILSYCFSTFKPIVGTAEVFAVNVCILLAFATTFKFQWVYRNFAQIVSNNRNRFLLALGLIFVMAIPIPSIFITGNWYIGNFVPNIWHNSTTIFLFPFAIILFTLSIKQLENYNHRRDWWILLFVFLNIFIKPSYFFVWVCVYPLFLLLKYKFTAVFFKGLIPVIIGSLLLLAQYYYIFHCANTYDMFGNLVYQESSIVVEPFFSYSIRSPISMLPWTLLFSALFPFIHLFLNFRRLRKNTTFHFVYISAAVALIVFLLFAETGIRANDSNFYWQIVICMWILFYVSLCDLLKNRKQINEKYVKISLIIFAVHAIAGIAYLGRYLFTGVIL